MARGPQQAQPEVVARPLPGVFQSAPGGDFGQFQAAQTQQAAQNVARLADTADRAAERIALQDDQTRTRELDAGFSAELRGVLIDPDKGYLSKRGKDAYDAVTPTFRAIADLRTKYLDQAGNGRQREMLERTVGIRADSAADRIAGHASEQRRVWQATTVETQFKVARQDAASDPENTNKLADSLGMVEAATLDKARLMGIPPDSDTAKVMIAEEKSKVYKATIQSQLDSGKKRAALAMYDGAKGQIGLKDDHALAAQMKGIAAEVRGEQVANEAVSKVGLPPVRSDDPASGDLIQRRQDAIGRLQQVGGWGEKQAKGIAANFEHESSFKPGAVNPRDGADGSDSIGLGQWNGPRAKALQQFAKSNSLSLADPDTAIRYMNAELDGTVPFSVSGVSPSLKGRLQNAKTEGEVAALMSREYFRPRAATEADSRAATAASYATPGTVYKGDLKAGYEQAAYDIASRSDLSKEERTTALAILNRTQSAVTSYQTAATKSLRDEVNATLATAFVNPELLKTGVLASFADRAAALGEQTLSMRYRLYASMEGTIKNGLSVAPADQVKMLKEISEDLPKQMLEGLHGGNGDMLAKANDSFAKLKQAHGDGLEIGGLSKLATETAQRFADAGKGEKAREVAQWFGSATAARQGEKMPPAAQQQALGEIEKIVAAGSATEQQLELYHLLKEGFARQKAAFDKDALEAGATLYGRDIGPLPPISDLPARAAYATQVSKLQGGRQVLPFTEPEIENLRRRIDTSPPEQQAQTMAILAALPAEMIPGVASALAGKKDAGDPLSRSYAAALPFYADRTPDSKQVADQILGGAKIIKDMGDAGKKAPTSAPAWQSTLQERMGNVFFDMKGMPAVVADAVASVYTYQMHKAGRQGETVDLGVLDKAITAVMGNTVARHGQAFLPPVRGMDDYEVDRAVRSINDLDLAGLKTSEGDAITAGVLVRQGRLSNAGKDGIYFVRIPDPRAGGELRPVVDVTGAPWRLDLRPFVARSRETPPGYAPDDQRPTGMRRRPVLPTLNDVPL